MSGSIQSKILAKVFRLFNFKKKMEQKAAKLIPRSKRDFVPRFIRKKYLLNCQNVESKTLATIEKRGRETSNHVLYFHGGAYLFEMIGLHWSFVNRIVEKSSCRISVLDYPLAPEHNFSDTFQMIQESHDRLLKQYPNDRFVLMGDSAGASLALAFTQKLAKEKQACLPKKLVLFSPWLDLTLSNPKIEKLETTDYLVSKKMLLTAAKDYAGNTDPRHYLLSPINGDFSQLPPALLYYASGEILSADCRMLQTSLGTKSGIHFREYKNMQHVWPIFPIPESKSVIDEVCHFLQN